MTNSEAVQILKKMKTRIGTDDMDTTIRIERENEAIDIAISTLLDYLPIRPNPSHIQRTSRVDVVFKYSCGNCGTYIREVWKACPICGRMMKWDD